MCCSFIIEKNFIFPMKNEVVKVRPSSPLISARLEADLLHFERKKKMKVKKKKKKW